MILIAMITSIFFASYHMELDTYLSEEIQEICEYVGNENYIEPALLMAIIETESSGRQYAENGGCKGLTQIYAKWHQDRMDVLGVEDIFDIEDNIRVCADYLNELLYRYEDIGLVLGLYNGNSKALELAHEGFLTDYADKVLTRSEEIRRARYGKEIVELLNR